MKAKQKKTQKGLTDAELIAKYGDMKAPFEKIVKKMLNTKPAHTPAKAS